MKKYINRISFLVLLTTLAACKISKNVETPKAALPETFRNAAATTDTVSIADLPLDSFFTDASLQKLLDSAIAKNYDMQVALKNIEASQLLFKQTRWAYLPDARLQISAGSNRPSDNSLNGLSASSFLKTTHIEDFTTSVGLSWEADIWGKIRNRNGRALAEYLQTIEAKNAIRTNLVAAVSQGFYNLLMLDAQLSIAEKNLALNDSTLRIFGLQFSSGQVTSLAIQQAEAQRLNAAKLIPELQQNITLQENALSILAGELPGRTERNLQIDQVKFPETLASGVPMGILNRRPDIRRSELALDVANANVGIAKANMYPALTITASGGINSFKASNWFNIPASLFGAAAGGLTQPLFQRNQLKTQYEVSKVERERTVLEFRQSVLYAVGEVSDALVKIEKLKEQQAIAATRVKTLEQAISNANLLFQSGLANYLEVITAQSNVLQSELELVAIKRAQLAANVDLYRSLGGGWK
ncbi:efflux transporter outer membrane subunit [Dyadobacter sp. LHD-138]|uniref:TolC family protein n=1 Tax=Dyadobacter sp. LHD-138 TaxID=3071413 RepID=UPI0027DFBA1D|nr:efflux transporter outer membrane subunit [Dyadobacter sp. LHD-138]MDQ6480008.1 efflux transporter outer membrane subunit [Dyadobacter sp. LHD-138]